MKKLHFNLFLIGIAVVLLGACKANQSSSQSNTQEPEVVDRGYDQALDKDVNQSSKTIKPNEKAPSNLTLADMLRRTSGVSVTGQGNNISVRIRGNSSFSASSPLYVVNGSPMGSDYAQVATTINPNDITSITVLKGSDAAIYGSRGGNGVIVIRTK